MACTNKQCFCTGKCRENPLEKALGGLEDDPDYVRPCMHPAHNPPTHIYIPEGKRYRHICPACGKEQIIKASRVTMRAESVEWQTPYRKKLAAS